MSELQIGESKKEASKKSSKKGRKEERSPDKICNRTNNSRKFRIFHL
jgi:hypothetical protein